MSVHMLVHPGLCEQAPAGVVKAWRSQVGVGVYALRAAGPMLSL